MPTMRPPRQRRPMRQRGIVSVVVMLFLIFTVIFALAKMLDVSGGNVIDGQRQGDSNAAFFLAESGVDKVHSAVATALNGSFTNTTCTNIGAAVGSPYNLAGGTVTISAESIPAICDNNTNTQCGTCKVTSTGTLRSASRTVTNEIALTSTNGTFCNGAVNSCTNSPTVTWQLKLRNSAGVGGIGLFVLSYEQQGNTNATCAVASNCQLQLQVASPSNGNNSVGLQGNSVQIPAGNTYPIYQVLSKSGKSAVEVGGFFLGTATPTLAGVNTASPGGSSYWGPTTVGTSGSTGSTNDGTLTSAGSCADPSASTQSCTNWCYGGDTLAFSYSANVTTVNDALDAVTFGTNGQNIDLLPIAKYPNALISGAPAGVDAEIWYASNPNLVGASPSATTVSSWKGRGTGAVGAQWTTTATAGTSIVTSGTAGNGTLTITSAVTFAGTAWPAQMLQQGDTISMTNGANTVTATIGIQSLSIETGGMVTGLGGRGTYAVSNIRNNGTLVTTNNTTFNGNSRTWIVTSLYLNASDCSVCFLANGDALSLTGLGTGRTINGTQQTVVNSFGRVEAAGGKGRYPISGTALRVAPATDLRVGTPGTTLYLPSAQPQPAVTSPQMLLAVKTGTGVLAPGTRVTAVGTPNAATGSFTVTTAPTTNLDGATICAGTCAFFVPGGTTNFSITKSANFNYWTSGFTCLKGVDITPQSVKSTSSIRGRWTEPVP